MDAFLYQWIDEAGIGKVCIHYHAQGKIVKEIPRLKNNCQNRIPESRGAQ